MPEPGVCNLAGSLPGALKGAQRCTLLLGQCVHSLRRGPLQRIARCTQSIRALFYGALTLRNSTPSRTLDPRSDICSYLRLEGCDTETVLSALPRNPLSKALRPQWGRQLHTLPHNSHRALWA